MANDIFLFSIKRRNEIISRRSQAYCASDAQYEFGQVKPCTGTRAAPLGEQFDLERIKFNSVQSKPMKKTKQNNTKHKHAQTRCLYTTKKKYPHASIDVY